MVMAASPTPSSSRAHQHPPYKEMIVGALEALKDENGSSRTAIAKYIEANNSDLPQDHDSLLSKHLRRLKKKGIIRMVRLSYKLSLSSEGLNSVPPNSPLTVPRKRGRPPKTPPVGADPTPLSSGGPNSVPPNSQLNVAKKRGRPPKTPSLGADPTLVSSEGPNSVPSNLQLSVPRKRGRPPKSLLLGADPTRGPEKNILGLPLKTLALVTDDPTQVTERKKRGRPPKTSTLVTGETTQVAGKRKRGRPSKTSISRNGRTLGSSGKKRGRPRKSPAEVGAGPPPVKRRLGRPRNKIASVSELILPKSMRSMLMVAKKRRGRPRKVPLAQASKPGAIVASGEKRKRGRPRKLLAIEWIPGWKRKPGRPQEGSSSMPAKVFGALSSGEKRKRGRPKKGSLPDHGNLSGGKRKRGRPKKESSTPKLKNPDVAVSSGIKRKVGRPRKEFSPLEPKPEILEFSEKRKGGWPKKEFSAVATPANLGSSEKRKVGRPKKVFSPEEAKSANVTESSQKRKPGRPKKLSSTALSSGEKRKRGRPKKFPIATENSVGSDFVIPLAHNIENIDNFAARRMVDAMLAAAGEGHVDGNSLNSMPENIVGQRSVEGTPVTANPVDFSSSGENSKQDDSWLHSSTASVTAKRRGRPPKKLIDDQQRK